MKLKLVAVACAGTVVSTLLIASVGASAEVENRDANELPAEMTAQSWVSEDLVPIEDTSDVETIDQAYVAVEDVETGVEAVLDTSMIDEGIAIATAPDFVDLSWAQTSPGAQYRVFRDGELVAETSDSSFRDAAVDAGSDYSYRIETVANDAVTTDADAIQVLGLLARVPEENDTTLVAAQSAQAAVAAAASSTAAWVDARTFIPQAKVDAPKAGCEYGSGYQFGGDNRSYSANSSKYRTRVLANIRFDSNNPRLSGSSAAIGTSHVYRKSTGALVATRTASASGLSVRELGSDGDQVDLRFSIQARMPFCSIGSIAGAFTMNVYKNGNWAIRSGSHRQMPNWEVYAGWAGGSNHTVYQRGYANAACLIQWACPETQMGGYTGDF